MGLADISKFRACKNLQFVEDFSPVAIYGVTSLPPSSENDNYLYKNRATIPRHKSTNGGVQRMYKMTEI